MNELEDLPYFSPLLRNFQTEFIGFVVTRFNVYQAFIKHIQSLPQPQQPMIDLCSGSGEPAIHIFKESNCFSDLILSDKFPNRLINADKISYLPDSMDVLKMEFHSGVCYTMFNAFHHFKDEDKLKIGQKILSSGSQSYFVEILEPTIICLLKVLFITTLGNLLLTPFIRPVSFTRIFFTYIIPVNIFTITYDGIVSVLKSRTINKYRKLFAGLGESVKVFKLKKDFITLIVIQIRSK
jgi:hypothetical protein